MRTILFLAFAVSCAFAADPVASVTLRGKLTLHEGKTPTVETPDHKLVKLDGDESTRKVLGDKRINGFEVEAKGHYTSKGQFLIDPIHTRSMLLRHQGSLKMVTYWCDICSIRAYTPGPCVCCQKETTLDLRDPDDIR